MAYILPPASPRPRRAAATLVYQAVVYTVTIQPRYAYATAAAGRHAAERLSRQALSRWLMPQCTTILQRLVTSRT